ncbi:MAG: flagellar export chaperone FlgN [Longimicrobiales bacterium]
MGAAPFLVQDPAGGRTASLATSPAHGAALVDALVTERRLLDELLRVLRAQRSGVSSEDLEAVDDSVFAAQRILLTMQQARRRRRVLLELVAGKPDLPLGDLDQVLGPLMTPAVRAARDDLQDGARQLARELEINRRVLSGALDSGEKMIRALSGQPAEPALYSDPRGASASGGGGLLNTRA